MLPVWDRSIDIVQQPDSNESDKKFSRTISMGTVLVALHVSLLDVRNLSWFFSVYIVCLVGPMVTDRTNLMDRRIACIFHVN